MVSLLRKQSTLSSHFIKRHIMSVMNVFLMMITEIHLPVRSAVTYLAPTFHVPDTTPLSLLNAEVFLRLTSSFQNIQFEFCAHFSSPTCAQSLQYSLKLLFGVRKIFMLLLWHAVIKSSITHYCLNEICINLLHLLCQSLDYCYFNNWYYRI